MSDFNRGLEQGIELGMLKERDRILKGVEALEESSHATRTPIYQDTFFKKIKELLHGTSN